MPPFEKLPKDQVKVTSSTVMNNLQGKRLWLIGASTGIGRDLALLLAKEGVAVVVSARNEGALQSLIQEMKPVETELGSHSLVVYDVKKMDMAKGAFEAAGELDGIIYCAGAYEPMTAHKPNLVALEEMVEINYCGAFRVLAEIVPRFVQRKSGYILLIGSISGYRGLPNAWGYGATKAALMHLAENLKCDLMGSGVRIQICNLGFVETRLTDKNNFKMPFIMDTKSAAQRIVKGMKSKRFEIAFPLIMVLALKFLALLPRPLYFTVISLMGNKSDRNS
ncbi:MAG: SDR family NAD(P)-dependent oxidoreductase [Rhodobacteraceae bacterium]|nr:SDR family NAD(P)-dependent oxidoreductase [Paracoccaceae bacterium]